LTELFEWSQTTVELEIPDGHQLGAAIKGEPGEIYYFTVEEGESEDTASIRDAFLYKVDYEGNVLKKVAVDTSKATGLNIYGMHTSCLLSYDDGKSSSSGESWLAMHLARTMTVSNDGLNH